MSPLLYSGPSLRSAPATGARRAGLQHLPARTHTSCSPSSITAKRKPAREGRDSAATEIEPGRAARDGGVHELAAERGCHERAVGDSGDGGGELPLPRAQAEHEQVDEKELAARALIDRW